MSEIFALHPDNPQSRLLRKAASIIEEGGLIIYPTDSGYAFGCNLGNKDALERIRKLRQLGKEHNICLALLESLDAPLMSSTLILPGATSPLSEPESIMDLLGNQVDLIINGGNCSHEPTTVVDLTGEYPVVIREGKGNPAPFKI